ncbi:Pentatricopeptide repeat-containing protein [Cladophialophora immunda]|nr:Pentatricopeptide repeat-containing protein [Cladophialophora immunda]
MKFSHLTRSVFRAILANKPYTIRGCQSVIGRRTLSQYTRTSYHFHHRRHLFGLNFGGARQGFQGAKSTPANVELALSKLVDLIRARRSQSRLPSDNEIIDALRFLFTSRIETPRRLTRNEVFLATEAFKHLQERGHVLTEDTKTSLSEEDLDNILLALASATGHDRFRTDARILATLVFDALKDWPRAAGAAEDLELPVQQGQHQRAQGSLLLTYITVLSKTGSAQDALELLRKSPNNSERASLPMWTAVLRGLANEGRMSEFWKLSQEVQKTVGPLDAVSQEILITYFAQHDEISTLKKVFSLPLAEGQVPTTPTLVKVVDCAMQNGELEWGAKPVHLLQQRTDSGDLAGTLLLWHATHDPDVNHIRQMIQQLSERGVTDAVSMRSLNRIVEYAYAQNNPETAIRYLDLAESLGLHPDARTRALQLNYELRRGDRAAAAQAYELLSREDIPLDRSDVPILNHYIAALSFSADPEYIHLMQVVDHLLESGAELEAEAIAGLCHVFLQKDELEEATGLLRHRVDSYPMDDRARIAAVFRQFIIDPTVKDQRAYNAYELFRHAFPESPVQDRVTLMQSFFDRHRPDLACLVFGHMRQREDVEARPTAEAYAKCFEGIAKCKDIDGLQMVYNMLKLDLEVEQTTRIHNGLMAAYTECQQPFVAIIDHFWKIMESREGPTLSSFILALRACERWIPQGGHEARRIMALMQSFNLVITKEVYDAYIGALAGQSEFENVVELIEHMERDIGELPDAVTIGTFYNAIPWQYRKDEVERWAKQAYPDLWAELESYGDVIDEEWEIRYFKVDRSVDMDDELLFQKGKYHPVIAQESQAALETPVH